MTLTTRTLGLLAASILLGAACGCDGSAKPVVEKASTYAKVSGKVTIKGKPATKGKVTFDLSNASPLAGSSRTADVKPDGSYEIEAPVGMNSVVVGAVDDPVAAGSYNTTTFEVTSKPTNTLDLDLPLNK